LFLIGGLLLLLHLRMPERLSAMFELGVAVMLLLLGALSIARAFRVGTRGPARHHEHSHVRHVHHGPRDHVHIASWTVAKRPLLVGLAHGTAGSGALTALVLANMPSLGSGLFYMICFGVGSSLGMALLAGIAGLPLRGLARKPKLQVGLNLLAGAISLGLGLIWGWPMWLRLTGTA
jgi:hypothetical protein